MFVCSHGIGSKNSYQVRVMITNRFYIALEEYERYWQTLDLKL